MRYVCGLVIALLIVFLSPPVKGETSLAPGNYTRTLKLGDDDRSYLVHVPPNYHANQPTPLVLVFHGALMNGPLMRRFCGLNEKADKEGFIAVYPNGTGPWGLLLTWNGGNCCGTAQWNHMDDVGFTRAMLDDLAKVVSVDTKRVYATGISNGGILCYRLASELSDRIAAIAPVAGTMVNDWRSFLNSAIREEEVRNLREHGRTGRPLGSESFVERSAEAGVRQHASTRFGCPPPAGQAKSCSIHRTLTMTIVMSSSCAPSSPKSRAAL